MAITTLDDFKRYCLRSLGAPIINIDVTDEQIQDRYEDALKMYQQHHFDGTERTYLSHQITATDIANKYIALPANITGVVRIIPRGVGAIGTGDSALFSAQHTFLMSEMSPLWNAGSISYYEHSMQHLTLLDQLLNGKPGFRFNKVRNRIYIDVSWERKLTEGTFIVIECQVALSPEENNEIWDDPWLKKYATAQIKRQWGEGLKKFAGVQLIGGVALNGQQIYDEAEQEILRLEQELRDVYEEPAEALWMG